MSKLGTTGESVWQRATIIAITAGILYNSWPLGYWLNPAVSKHSLASGLEAYGQPYNWVFIAGDIASSLLMLVVIWLLHRRYSHTKHRALLISVLLSTVVFSLATIIDTALPEHCVPGLNLCPGFNHDLLLFMHGVFSILASLGLFIGLCLIWWRHRHYYLLNALMLGYILFGLISFIEAVTPGSDGNWSQHYYITLCSVWLAAMPYVLHRALSSSRGVELKLDSGLKKKLAKKV